MRKPPTNADGALAFRPSPPSCSGLARWARSSGASSMADDRGARIPLHGQCLAGRFESGPAWTVVAPSVSGAGTVGGVSLADGKLDRYALAATAVQQARIRRRRGSEDPAAVVLHGQRSLDARPGNQKPHFTGLFLDPVDAA